MAATEDWTTAHDLALIYSGLACVDRDLTDAEVSAIEQPLREWIPLSADTTAGAVVQEAAQALRQSQKEVRRSVRRVRRELDDDERQEILQHLLRIAQADGVLIAAERELIHTIATAWDLKHLDPERDDAPAVDGQRGDEWSLLHEIAFLFVQVGHGSGDGLDAAVLGVMADRLREWQSAEADDEVQDVLQRAVRAYADRTDEPLLQDSVEGLNEALSDVQKLIVLDDLHTVVQADGPPTSDERQSLRTLAEAWGIHVRIADD